MTQQFEFTDDLPEVQKGSIVSRKLEAGPVRRVVAFAFAAGEELTEHTTPMEARIEVHTGRLTVRVGDQAMEAGPGSVVRLPANVPHALQASEDSQVVLFMRK